MLWSGRLDVAVGGLRYSKYYLDELNKSPEYKGIADDIIEVGAPLAIRDVFLMISKKAVNSKQKQADFNLGLKKIVANGTFKKIISKYQL